jgi:hypothetical protein
MRFMMRMQNANASASDETNTALVALSEMIAAVSQLCVGATFGVLMLSKVR